jgi:DNA ligase-1
LTDGESVEVKGSGAKPYVLKNVGGVYSCSCPAWRNVGGPIEARTCKHLRGLLGDEAETTRVGTLSKPAPTKKVTAPPVLLANVWTSDIDPTGWWMSEKLDGVRAWWDGENFISRLGNLYHAPDWFKSKIPPVPLDGELWLGRKKFQQCISIVRRQDKNDEWKKIKYVVFDAPKARGPFHTRMHSYLKALYEANANSTEGYTQLLAQTECEGHQHLKATLEAVERLGGEGLMLRDPDADYEEGRSSTLLKVKSFIDAEATVIGHEAGKGKHKGRLGALAVKLENGIQFSLGTGFSDKERENPPPVGSIVTFRYQELSNTGVPRFPSFIRVREDA